MLRFARFLIVIFLGVVSVWLLTIILAVYLATLSPSMVDFYQTYGLTIAIGALLAALECRLCLLCLRIAVFRGREEFASDQGRGVFPVLIFDVTALVLVLLLVSIIISVGVGRELVAGAILWLGLVSAALVVYMFAYHDVEPGAISEIRVSQLLIPITGRYGGTISLPGIKIIWGEYNHLEILERSFQVASWVVPVGFVLLTALATRLGL